MTNTKMRKFCFSLKKKGDVIMKKILITFSVLLLMGFAFDIQATDFSEWAVGDTIGPKGESAQFCAVDYEGKLWVTDYGAPGGASV